MTFSYHQVPAPLSANINFLYAAHGAMPYDGDQIFPTASTDLKINLGAPWLVEDPALSARQALDVGWCMGIWDHHHVVTWPSHVDFVGVSFKPGGAHCFLGSPMSDLRGRIVPLDAIWGADAHHIRQRLGEATSVERRFALLEAFLLNRWQEVGRAAAIVGSAVTRIRRSHGAARISTLSREMDVSHKHLITLFDRVVGCTPKELARLARFHHALDVLDARAPVRWIDVAHEHEFADQAHFNRDFTAYAGLTPTDYLARRRAVYAECPEHASVPWVLPAG